MGLGAGLRGRFTSQRTKEKCLLLQQECNNRKSFPPRSKALVHYSVKSQLVCSVNKASELIGDLKKLEGKGLALKSDPWLVPTLSEKLN